VRALLAFAWMMMAPGCDPADGNDDAAADSGAGGKADDAGELECQLSDLGLDVFDAIYFGDFEWSTVPAPRTLTYANEAGAALVDGPQIFPELGRLIEAAEHDVNLAMFVFNPGTDPSREVFDGIARLESRLADEGRHGNPVIVRIVINANNVLGGDGAAIPNIRAIEALDLDPELVDVEVATRGSWFRGAMHQKLVVIDGDVVHIGGANVQDEHDWTTPEQTPWRDSAYVLRGEIAQSLLFDFERMWSEAQEWTCPNDDDDDCRSDDTLPFERVVPELGEGCVPMMALTRRARGWFNNDTDHPHARGFLAAMDGAKKLLRIQTPNLNDDAAKDAILRAVARGVRVELILPISFNDTFESLPDQGGTNAENVDEIYARALHETNAEHACEYLHVHWFGQDEVGIVDGNVEGQSHVKYLSVDHQMVILGSTNMDTQSWNYSGEANVIIDDPDVTDRYDAAVFERSLATSPAAGHCAGFR
jgi:phosphatidylserine/phosphatidylglycerophosphate/cardiolipin synthase-like enzyme